MQDSLCVGSMGPGVLVDLRRAASRPWTSGLPCCARRWREITTGWTWFWLLWNTNRKENRNEQDDAEDRRRHTYSCDKALRRASRGGVPGAHGSEPDPEVVAGSGRLDDASVHQ